MSSTKRTPNGNWSLPYVPRAYMIPFHQRTERFAYILMHRRGGKTVAAVAELVIRALYTTKKNAQYFYISPFLSQSKAIAWSYCENPLDGVRQH